MITISRPINGITLNGDEFLLDGDGNVAEFMSRIEAYMFLQDKGLTTEEVDAITFHDSDDEQLAVQIALQNTPLKVCEDSIERPIF